MRALKMLVLSLCLSVGLSAATTTVNVGSNFFNSNSITVAVGDTVHWVNTGGFHNVLADGVGFTSGGASGGAWTYDFPFTAVGAYPYYCQIHGCCGGAAIGSTMNGVVNVVSPSNTPTSTESPTQTQSPTSTSTPTATPTVTDVPPGSSSTDTPTVSPTFSHSPPQRRLQR